MENNYVLNKIDNCKNLSSKECGRAGDLVNQIFEYNPELPSLDDLNSLLSNCETESCAVKVLQEHHKEISDATLATIKEMGIQGELSREDIAFIESMVGSEILLQLQGHSGETGGGKLWQHELLNSWTNGQELYSFLDNEYRIKELVDEGYSPEEAAAKVGKEEFLTTLASMLVGGGKGGKKPSTNKVTDGKTSAGTSNKDKGKEESGKQGQTANNKANSGKEGNNQNESKFKSPELLDSHYDKHANEMKVVFNKKNYTKQDYLNDADFVKKEGTYVPELNGYVKLVGGEGRAKYAFVGVDRKTGDITTFHFKTVSELSKTAPSLGINK